MASMNGLSKLGLPKLSDNMDPEDARALRSYCLLYTSHKRDTGTSADAPVSLLV